MYALKMVSLWPKHVGESKKQFVYTCISAFVGVTFVNENLINARHGTQKVDINILHLPAVTLLVVRFQQNTNVRLLFCIMLFSTYFDSYWSIVREIQFNGLYMLHEYTFSSDSATRVSLHVQDIVVPDTEWPVQHWSYAFILILVYYN